MTSRDSTSAADVAQRPGAGGADPGTRVDLPETDPNATQEMIEQLEAESPMRKLTGFWAVVVTLIACGLSVYALAIGVPIGDQGTR